MARVVSLVPSVTETLVAFGVVPVACTRFCEFDGAPAVGGTKNPDIAAIVALAPDVVVVNDEENRIEDADALRAAGLALHSMSPRRIDDVGRDVGALAALVGVTAPAPFDAWDAWLDETRREVHATAFVAIWRRPFMTLNAATYGSSVLAHLGIANVSADAPERYPEVTLAQVAVRAPQLVLLPSEPYAFEERHRAEVQKGVPSARVELVDGRDLFWWGSRTPAAIARLGEVL